MFRPQQGVALVITLIMLAIITFLAVTFLAVSRREKGSVSATTDQNTARMAADAALARAEAELITPMLAFTNPYNFSLLVSTNYVNRAGFDPAAVDFRTNVNFDYLANGNPLTADQARQNLANLLYDPRPPVYVTNRTWGSNEFRFYLDLNRNGRDDPSGAWPVLSGDPANPYYDANGNPIPSIIPGNTLSNFFVGDPEWIGVLAHPDQPHGPNNFFVARYAYLAVPTGDTLDLNYIHNHAKTGTPPGFDGFLRNQGVGSWELNLAAFLADLNTNVWDVAPGTYQYYPEAATTPSGGFGFTDASRLLQWRDGGNYQLLNSVSYLFGPPGAIAFSGDMFDGYTGGPLMTNTWGWNVPADADQPRTGFPWSGADNPNHYFTTQDLFDGNKANYGQGTPNFTNHLALAGASADSYDRYTFYRLLSQLGTDSAPEAPGKMNLNYDNLTPTNGAPSSTNFLAWQPLTFFTNAADRLLRAQFGFGVKHIPVFINNTNLYLPSVHRLLQLAANIFDATTNRTLSAYPYLPSVFRPIFRSAVTGTNLEIYIAGFVEETDDRLVTAPPPLVDLADSTSRNQIRSDTTYPTITTDAAEPMVYNVPLVIGAKKGFPNFNEFAMQPQVTVNRKLEFRRSLTTGKVNETNQLYLIGISNVCGVEAWNSYGNPFPRDLRLIVSNELTMVLSDDSGVVRSNRTSITTNIFIGANTWPAFIDPQYPTQPSLLIPLSTNVAILSASTWRPNQFPQLVDSSADFERNSGFPVPHWRLNLNTRLSFILEDITTSPHRIVDYVNLNNSEDTLDVMGKETENADCGTLVQNSPDNLANWWCTNRVNNSPSIYAPTYGIQNQIVAGLFGCADCTAFLMDPIAGNDPHKAVDAFRFNLLGISPLYPEDQGKTFYKSNVFYAPFVSYLPIYAHPTWQANDPLVHYLIGDLLERTNSWDFTSHNPPLDNLGQINNRYEPWGGNPSGRSSSQTKFNLTVKDPLVRRSDDWQFPTNKFPTIGWLGRVHRGTPWQTIYMKSADVDAGLWRTWTANPDSDDAQRSKPISDRTIFDLFTTAINDNASRGQLSINAGAGQSLSSLQGNLAAWSALFSGVIVLSNSTPDNVLNIRQPPTNYLAFPIEPVGALGAGSPLYRLVEGINRERANTNVHPREAFEHLGDILAVPELTVNSPFLNLSTAQTQFGLNDAAYEWLPQQVLSLLRVGTPRFVIYAYGQSLWPAPNAIYTGGGPLFGICTNYQITSETATRTVLRVDGSPDPRNANNPDPNLRYPPHIVIENFNILPPD